MIQRIILLLLAAMTLNAPLSAGVWDGITSLFKKSVLKETPAIRVLIAADKNKMDLCVDGPFKAYDPNTGDMLLLSKLGKHAILQVMDGGLKWSEEFPGVHQMLIVPYTSDTKIYIDGVSYPGIVYLYDVENKLSAVNKVSIETYLCSILSDLNEDETPKEVLSAIAITERTNSFYLAENPSNPFWCVDAAKTGYHGNIDLSTSLKMNRIIFSTRNMVLSKTGTYEGVITPFLTSWKADSLSSKHTVGISSKITLKDAKGLAVAGKNAAHLLREAFPNSTVQMIR